MTAGDPRTFFEELYQRAAAGADELPWEREGPHPLIGEWSRGLDGAGRRALVVGSGLGTDAEFVASLGFAVDAFDFSATAVALARGRHPRSPVQYRVADLLAPPPEWERAFDLVVESLTVQSLPVELHASAIENVAGFVGAGGTLLVIATVHGEMSGGPPWPLTRAEINSFADGGLEIVRVECVARPDAPRTWRAEFRRP